MKIYIHEEERGFYVTRQIKIFRFVITLHLVRKMDINVGVYYGWSLTKKRRYFIIFESAQDAANWFSNDPDIICELAIGEKI